MIIKADTRLHETNKQKEYLPFVIISIVTLVFQSREVEHKAVSFKCCFLQIPDSCIYLPSNTVTSLTCFGFTVMGRGILYSFFVNIIAFGRTIGSNETKHNLLWLLSCFPLWAILSACVNPGAELPSCSTLWLACPLGW